MPDDKWQERPLAVSRPGCRPHRHRSGMTNFCVRGWPEWWLPERWAFVTDVPLTSTGKFDKKKLRRQFGDGDLIIETLA